MVTLEELAASAAFIVVHPDHPGIAATISGDYITLVREIRPGLYDYIEVVPHGVPARSGGGILGADAAALHETTLAAIVAWEEGGEEALFPEDDAPGWRYGYVNRLVPSFDPEAFQHAGEARKYLADLGIWGLA
jgi:hypothetical protein